MSLIAITRHPGFARQVRSGHAPSVDAPRPPLATAAFLASSLFMLLFADALLHERAFFDAWALRQFQADVDGPGVGRVLMTVNHLTASHGAVAAWAVTLVAMAAMRRWLMALAVMALPIAGGLNEIVGMVAQHERPAGDAFLRTVETNAASFPSGHVMGAVMLYGLLFVFAGGISVRPVRYAAQAAAATVVLLVGPARLYEGAHWPTDVLGAYSLGIVFLAAILAVYFRADRAWGHLPLLRQAPVPHDETLPHAHALTSLVVFNGDTVAKVYTPGLLPRMLYAAAFQAPFPYIGSRAALEAAVARRNLAAILTGYWYGTPRVARALGVGEAAGRPALVSEFVDGHEPGDRRAAKAFLRGLRANFEAAGLPTWQIDPRQPRAADNLLEVAPGDYRIVDLESGLVAPVASPRSFVRGFRRGMFPLFDDVHFDITRAYVADEGEAIRTALGGERYAELLATLDLAEAKQQEWHAGEPRLIGRFAGGFRSGWNYRAWPERVARLTARGQAKANGFLREAVERWADEGRVTPAEAARMHAQVEGAEVQAVMPHLGAHAAITVALRFPFGSIARFAWTAGALVAATVRLAAGRSSLAEWKRSWTMHSPVVLALSVIPGFGAFAYLAVRPVRQNRLLMRAVLDALCLKVPFGLYERTGVRRTVARPAGLAPVMAADPAPEAAPPGPQPIAA